MRSFGLYWESCWDLGRPWHFPESNSSWFLTCPLLHGSRISHGLASNHFLPIHCKTIQALSVTAQRSVTLCKLYLSKSKHRAAIFSRGWIFVNITTELATRLVNWLLCNDWTIDHQLLELFTRSACFRRENMWTIQLLTNNKHIHKNSIYSNDNTSVLPWPWGLNLC